MHLGSLLILILACTIQNVISEDDPYRLPPNYIINHQNIDLVVPAEAFTADSSNYSGSVSIEFQVRFHDVYTRKILKKIIIIYIG